jgi:predicted nucleic acid-binding protein
MRFWDSSAIVPLVVEQARSRACRSLRRADPSIAAWALSRLEILSAIHRLVRERALPLAQVAGAVRRLDAVERDWTEVEPAPVVRERAERLLAVHPLAAGDALQLAAAIVIARDRPRGRAFVTADERLAAAARAEGFMVVVPEP